MNQGSTPSGYAIAGISGFALIIVMLLFAWFGFSNVTDAGGIDAFKSFHDWVLFFLIFTAFAGMALYLTGSSAVRVDLPVALSAITMALAVVSLIILIIYLISPPSVDVGGLGSISLDRKIGIWLGLFATAGVAIGGYLSMQDEGAGFTSEADRAGPGATPPVDRPATPPPPTEPTGTSTPPPPPRNP
jgi:hypothetical protein